MATLPWALTDNFMEMRQGRAVLLFSGAGSPLARGMGSSFLREVLKKVRASSGMDILASQCTWWHGPMDTCTSEALCCC